MKLPFTVHLPVASDRLHHEFLEDLRVGFLLGLDAKNAPGLVRPGHGEPYLAQFTTRGEGPAWGLIRTLADILV